uniref:Uncharacterized protein n=1 Tax=Scophthalmus maximus TaxID=52904 RepID=A0A8D3C356_SCOMX
SLHKWFFDILASLLLQTNDEMMESSFLKVGSVVLGCDMNNVMSSAKSDRWWSLQASTSMHRLNRCGEQEQPCLTPFCKLNGCDISQLVIMEAWG